MRKFLLAMLLIAACTKSSTPTAKKDQLRFPLFTEPQSWDTTVATDPTSREILFHLMEGLVKHERYGKVAPALADRWEIAKDGKTYTFFLRAAKWSDGRELRAEDFIFAWQRLLDPKSTHPLVPRLFAIDKAEDFHAGRITNFAEVGVKAVEPLKLVLTLSHPDGGLLEAMTDVAAFPQRADLMASDAFQNPEKLRVTGPYVVKKYEKGRELHLFANGEYFSRRPQIAHVTISFFKDLAAAAAKYDKGELDVLMPVPTGENEKWKQSLDFEAVAVMKASAPGLVSQQAYETVGVMAKPYLDNFPVDIYGHPMFAQTRFKLESPTEQ